MSYFFLFLIIFAAVSILFIRMQVRTHSIWCKFQAYDESINWLVDDTCFEHLTITNIYVCFSTGSSVQKWLGASQARRTILIDLSFDNVCSILNRLPFILLSNDDATNR